MSNSQRVAVITGASQGIGEGLVSAYIHPGGRLGVLIEVNCETDFVARTDDFQKLVRDLAMQVAGLAPEYTTIESPLPQTSPAFSRPAYSLPWVCW